MFGSRGFGSFGNTSAKMTPDPVIGQFGFSQFTNPTPVTTGGRNTGNWGSLFDNNKRDVPTPQYMDSQMTMRDLPFAFINNPTILATITRHLLMMDNSWIFSIFPIVPWTAGLKVKWTTHSFPAFIPTRVPHQGIPKLVTSSIDAGEETMARFGVGLVAAQEYLKTPEGREKFFNSIIQMNNCVRMGMEAQSLYNMLFKGGSWAKNYLQKQRSYDSKAMLTRVAELELETFGILNQHDNGWEIMDANIDLKHRQWSERELNTYVTDARVAVFLQKISEKRTEYYRSGDQAIERLRQGIEAFDMDPNGKLRMYLTRGKLGDSRFDTFNPLLETTMMGAYFECWDRHSGTNYKDYGSGTRTNGFHSETDKGSWAYITLKQKIDNCYRFRPDGSLASFQDLPHLSPSIGPKSQRDDFLMMDGFDGLVEPVRHLGQIRKYDLPSQYYYDFANSAVQEISRQVSGFSTSVARVFSEMKRQIRAISGVQNNAQLNDLATGIIVSNDMTPEEIRGTTQYKSNIYNSLNLPLRSDLVDKYRGAFSMSPFHLSWGGFKTMAALYNDGLFEAAGFSDRVGRIVNDFVNVFDDLVLYLEMFMPGNPFLDPKKASVNIALPGPGDTWFEHIFMMDTPTIPVYLANQAAAGTGDASNPDIGGNSAPLSLVNSGVTSRFLGNQQNFADRITGKYSLPTSPGFRINDGIDEANERELVPSGSEFRSQFIREGGDADKFDTVEHWLQKVVVPVKNTAPSNERTNRLSLAFLGRKLILMSFMSVKEEDTAPATVNNYLSLIEKLTQITGGTTVGRLDTELLTRHFDSVDKLTNFIEQIGEFFRAREDIRATPPRNVAMLKQIMGAEVSSDKLQAIKSYIGRLYSDISSGGARVDQMNYTQRTQSVYQLSSLFAPHLIIDKLFAAGGGGVVATGGSLPMEAEFVGAQLDQEARTSALTSGYTERQVQRAEEEATRLVLRERSGASSSSSSSGSEFTEEEEDAFKYWVDRLLGEMTKGREELGDPSRPPSTRASSRTSSVLTDPRASSELRGPPVWIPADPENIYSMLLSSKFFNSKKKVERHFGQKLQGTEYGTYTRATAINEHPVMVPPEHIDKFVSNINNHPLFRKSEQDSTRAKRNMQASDSTGISNSLNRRIGGTKQGQIQADLFAPRTYLRDRREAEGNAESRQGAAPYGTRGSAPGNVGDTLFFERGTTAQRVDQIFGGRSESRAPAPRARPEITRTDPLLGLEVTENMELLWAEIANEKGNMVLRMIALTHLLTPVTKHSADACSKNNLAFYMNFLCVRAHAVYVGADVIKTIRDGAVGQNILGNTILAKGSDSTRQITHWSVFYYSACMITAPEDIFIVRNALIVGYVRGYDDGFYNLETYKPMTGVMGDGRQSFHIFAVPWAWRNPSTSISITGPVKQPHDNEMGVQGGYIGDATYPTWAFYCALWGFQNLAWNDTSNLKPLSRLRTPSITPNQLCFQDFALYMKADGTTINGVRLSCGHFRDGMFGPGAHDVRIGKIQKKKDYFSPTSGIAVYGTGNMSAA